MQKLIQLRLGEKELPKAPKVKLSNGAVCIPQHYLTYHHTLESVEALICAIDYDPRYLIFAAQEDNAIYIQIGVIGHDNYKKAGTTNESKLLFGRKWRVEPELPTSEIIQTVFLAIKKSREHEVRELFKLAINNSITTPFNSHIDLPLMAECYQGETHGLATNNSQGSINNLTKILTAITFDHSQLQLVNLEQRKNGLWLIDIKVNTSEKSILPELMNEELNIQVKGLSLNEVSRALMNEFIRLSDLHVDENFSYQGFKRFDPNIEIAEIAHLSQQTRKIELNESFMEEFINNNYLTDQMRIPPLKPGPLAEKHKDTLERFKWVVS